jgi:hypothetical protein
MIYASEALFSPPVPSFHRYRGPCAKLGKRQKGKIQEFLLFGGQSPAFEETTFEGSEVRADAHLRPERKISVMILLSNAVSDANSLSHHGLNAEPKHKKGVPALIHGSILQHQDCQLHVLSVVNFLNTVAGEANGWLEL